MLFYIYLELLKSHPLFKSYTEVIKELLALISRDSREHLWGEDESEMVLIAMLQKKAFPLWEFVDKNKAYIKNRKNDLQEAQEIWGYHFLHYGHPFYPKAFYRMSDPPLQLMVWGDHFPWMHTRTFGVVGSRDPSHESIEWMEQHLPRFLQNNSLLTVSGGARGVDQRLHSLSLRQKRSTCVVLPSGLNKMYPSSMLELASEIRFQGGCFISEYSLDAPMRKHLFHHRNRLIAALSEVVLIVEARERSGTMLTAQLATELGRPTLIVPGHPVDFRYSGSLRLLSEGGTMVRDAEDLSLIFETEKWGELRPDYL